jgi:hypothetical protein
MKLFLVDAVSTFRNSYVVRCKDEVHATDTVTLNEAVEWSQDWLGETVSRVREISEEEYLVLFDKDNDYLKDWDAKKKKSLIHTVNYDDLEPGINPIADGKAEI